MAITPISDLVRGKTLRDKSIIKSRELQKVVFPNNKFSINGYNITFITPPTETNGLLTFSIEVKRGIKTIPVSNPFFIKNPPILVFENGVRVENTEKALKEMIYSIVKEGR